MSSDPRSSAISASSAFHCLLLLFNHDVPEIEVVLINMPERGVIGIGEPPTISTHAAIGNAIFNALEVRVSQTPFTPERVLAALAQPQKGGKKS